MRWFWEQKPLQTFNAVVYERRDGTWNWAIIAPGAPYGNAPDKVCAKAEAYAHTNNGTRYRLEFFEV